MKPILDNLPTLMCLGIGVYFIVRWLTHREQRTRYIQPPDDYAEDWSQTAPPRWNPPLEFSKVRIGQQFIWERDPNNQVFEKIKTTPTGSNARCDLYDINLSDTDIVRLVTTHAWKN